MLDNLDVFPPWIDKRSTGKYLELNAQLCTRDGRKIGNARVKSITDYTAKIVTDRGTIHRLNLAELQELFYNPEFILKDR